MKGNLVLGLIAGVVSCLIGAAIWTAVTISSGYQIGWMAVGVGFLVGYAVRFLGKGNTVSFSIIGAVCALLGCVFGNLFSGIGFIAQDEGISIMEGIAGFDYAYSFELLQAMFIPMDLLFYAIAIYEGFKFSVVPGVVEEV
ncbi:MAG: hypothetical protein AAGH40_09585 [Verrucomicrobiota bacterium]